MFNLKPLSDSYGTWPISFIILSSIRQIAAIMTFQMSSSALNGLFVFLKQAIFSVPHPSLQPSLSLSQRAENRPGQKGLLFNWKHLGSREVGCSGDGLLWDFHILGEWLLEEKDAGEGSGVKRLHNNLITRLPPVCSMRSVAQLPLGRREGV